MSIDGLKELVDKKIRLEKERRKQEGKDKAVLKVELSKLQINLSSVIDSYNKQLKEGLKKIISDTKQRKESGINAFFLDKDNLPMDSMAFHDFIYNLTMDINKEIPSDKRMKVVLEARNTAAIFYNLFLKKDPMIFEIVDKPTCYRCGHEVDGEKMEKYFTFVDGLWNELTEKMDLVVEIRNNLTSVLQKIDSDKSLIDAIKEDLKKDEITKI